MKRLAHRFVRVARRMVARVLAADSLGLRPIGYFDDDVPVGTKLRQRESPALVVEGDLEALVRFARDGGVDYVYVALPLANEERVMALIHALSDTTASVFFVPDFFVFEMLQARWTDIDGMPVVSVFDTPFLGVDGWRGETDTVDKMQKRVEYDLDYIRNWSIGLDLKIVALTVVRGFAQAEAY